MGGRISVHGTEDSNLVREEGKQKKRREAGGRGMMLVGHREGLFLFFRHVLME